VPQDPGLTGHDARREDRTRGSVRRVPPWILYHVLEDGGVPLPGSAYTEKRAKVCVDGILFRRTMCGLLCGCDGAEKRFLQKVEYLPGRSYYSLLWAACVMLAAILCQLALRFRYC
jgi:hypothetical protein